MDLYLDLQRNTVNTDRSGNNGNAELQLNQGDNMRVRLWLMQPNNGPTLRDAVPLPSPYTQLKLTGKASSALGGARLFTQGTWDTVSEVFNAGLENEYTEVHYEADLNLNTTEIAAVMDASGAVVDQFDINWSIEFNNGSTLRWTPLPRGVGKMLRDIEPGTSGAPEAADPPYPAADQIAPLSGSNFEFALVSGSYQLRVKNSTTGAFHKVSIIGAAGEEQLVIDTAA